MTVIVYGDFNCFYGYLASQRADRLIRTGTAEIDWRAVEHNRRLPVTGIRSDPGRDGWEQGLAEAEALALPGEQLPATPPPVAFTPQLLGCIAATSSVDDAQTEPYLPVQDSQLRVSTSP